MLLETCNTELKRNLFIGLIQHVGIFHLRTFSFGPSVSLFLKHLIAFFCLYKLRGNYSFMKHEIVIIPLVYVYFIYFRL